MSWCDYQIDHVIAVTRNNINIKKMVIIVKSKKHYHWITRSYKNNMRHLCDFTFTLDADTWRYLFTVECSVPSYFHPLVHAQEHDKVLSLMKWKRKKISLEMYFYEIVKPLVWFLGTARENFWLRSWDRKEMDVKVFALVNSKANRC